MAETNSNNNSTFATRKEAVVSSLVEVLDAERRDKSPKGFIDAPILDLMHIINRHPEYYTTSSCSGRVAVYCEGLENETEKSTKGGEWLYVTHDPVPIPEKVDDAWVVGLLFGNRPVQREHAPLLNVLNHRLIYFKFEPLILHVEAATAEACMRLNNLAYQAGYQNSGITPSRRHMLAIRSTHKIDTPIAYLDNDGSIRCLVDPTYLYTLVLMSNDKFTSNQNRMKAFEQIMEKEVQQHTIEVNTETKEQRRERKRREGMARQQFKQPKKESHPIEDPNVDLTQLAL
ncbi:methyltransferase TYW3-domain-containing protein [Syncephalastrum racemosum]|uniref:tRNA wybutosine-synthesizing protein 3 n=1 Tax=Syncephalastrum racemosum TaxID=13706 RepID=A0A1X2HG42_SYNRA|nr:methyltransferase TYW3-domain-containing protein [Syncephalastrum racemosum]